MVPCCVAWCGRRVKESKVSILVFTCLYLSELRRRTLSCVKESSVVASPLSCSPSPADSWRDVHEVPPWHLPTNKLRFFWRVVIDLLITDPFGCCGANTKTSMKVYLIPLLMLSILVSVVDDHESCVGGGHCAPIVHRNWQSRSFLPKMGSRLGSV